MKYCKGKFCMNSQTFRCIKNIKGLDYSNKFGSYIFKREKNKLSVLHLPPLTTIRNKIC